MHGFQGNQIPVQCWEHYKGQESQTETQNVVRDHYIVMSKAK